MKYLPKSLLSVCFFTTTSGSLCIFKNSQVVLGNKPSSTKMAELVLDPAIRLWVILPIVVITFLIGIIRHYLSILLQSKKEVDIQGVTDRYATNPLQNIQLMAVVSSLFLRPF
jgi:hypothetical protein